MITENSNPSNISITGQAVYYDISLLSEDDLFLFNEGKHYRLYQKLGAHLLKREETKGNLFRSLGT